MDEVNQLPPEPPFEVPEQLLRLHDAVITYSVEVHKLATQKQEREPHLSYEALAIISMRAVTIHRAILDLCRAGWTPVASILIRTLGDLYANALAIVFKSEDTELMAFRYLLNFPISQAGDTSVPKKLRAKYRAEIDQVIARAHTLDPEKAEQFLASYKPVNYWYQPEHSSPTDLLKKTQGDMKLVYRVFSGAVHGGTVGLGFLDDKPDEFDVNPRSHPKRNRLAVALSSRWVLEISFLRDSSEETGLQEHYTYILTKLFLPLKEMVGADQIIGG
jgi:hypothetical protein